MNTVSLGILCVRDPFKSNHMFFLGHNLNRLKQQDFFKYINTGKNELKQLVNTYETAIATIQRWFLKIARPEIIIRAMRENQLIPNGRNFHENKSRLMQTKTETGVKIMQTIPAEYNRKLCFNKWFVPGPFILICRNMRLYNWLCLFIII